MDKPKQFDEIIIDNGFRDYLNQRMVIANSCYDINTVVPLLYRYRSFRKHDVDEILNGNLQLSSITTFNDSMEGNMCLFKNEEEIDAIVESRVAFHHDLIKGFPPVYSDDYLRKSERRMLLKKQNNYSKLLGDSGAYVGSFSEESNSTLMWSHYADSHRGICVEYDFNDVAENSILHKLLFPVCYTENPVYLGDLIKDKDNDKICSYPVDTAVVCALINKSTSWQYEREWRIIYDMNMLGINGLQRWIKIKNLVGQEISPKSITFGYHFMQNMFYYNDERNDFKDQEEAINDFKRLMEYVAQKNILTYCICPSIGSFALKRILVEPQFISGFINYYLKSPEKIEQYNALLSRWHEMINQIS